MITFACSGCGKGLRVADGLAGKRVKCSSCQTVLQAPETGVTIEPPARLLCQRNSVAQLPS